MPDVTGKRLDVAISDVERAGINDEVEVLGGGMFGVVDESNWTVCSQEPKNGVEVSIAPRLTVERSCEMDGTPTAEPSDEPAQAPSQESTQEPEASQPEPEAYSYKGPQYEIVSVDSNQTPAGLHQYWVYTSGFDYSTDSYKDQIKMIIADIAHTERTDKFLAEVVTDKEIAEAESPSTTQSFIEEHGDEYFLTAIPEKEKTGWVASYTGGFDRNTGEPSDSTEAFEVIWFIATDAEIEKWKPQVAG
ncbi:hypothetical protein GCM10009784_26960 [Arthrobacter parietis]|uniref:PASTA domain-containing protein n=2 Tax=Arthrobacter parietis TaxID=271434 RepID=A0ABP5MQS7_9MICC